MECGCLGGVHSSDMAAATQPRPVDPPAIDAEAQAAKLSGIYAEIIHRSMVEDGFAEGLVNLTGSGRAYLENIPLSGTELYELLYLLRLTLRGAVAEQQQSAELPPSPPPPPPDPPAPDSPEIQERKAYFANLQYELAKKQIQYGDKSLQDTMTVVADMKLALSSTIAQIDRAFRWTMWMYIVSFAMGVSLIVAAIVAAFTGYHGDTKLLSMVLGGLGTATTLAFFFTKPPESLQSSRASLAQLQCALLAWFNDFYNQNTLLGLISTGQRFDRAAVQQISREILDHTDDILGMLQRYCKLIENPTDVSNATMMDSVKKVMASEKSRVPEPNSQP